MTGASDDLMTAWARLLRVQPRLLAAVEGELAEAGFPPLAWYDVLLELGRAPGGLRPFELEARLLLAQYGVSRLVARLEAARLVERRPCPEDGRGQVLHATAEGRDLRQRMWPAYRTAVERHLGRHLTPAETAELARLLGKLAASG